MKNIFYLLIAGSFISSCSEAPVRNGQQVQGQVLMLTPGHQQPLNNQHNNSSHFITRALILHSLINSTSSSHTTVTNHTPVVRTSVNSFRTSPSRSAVSSSSMRTSHR